MNFAFDMGETITRYPAEMFTIMECLRLGGHRVVIWSDGPIPQDLGFDFNHFEKVIGSNKPSFCADNSICALFDNDPGVMDQLHEVSPSTARLRVMP